MNILLAGGTGLVGKALQKKFIANHTLYILTRSDVSQSNSTSKFIQWDGKSINLNENIAIDAVVNLCGQGIAERKWDPKRKQQLIDSRVQSTKALVDWAKKTSVKPKIFINASAIGYYGNRESERLDENSLCGEGFLSDLCSAWEGEALKFEKDGGNVSILRLGIILSSLGGALQKFVPSFQWYIGGPLGSGKQMMSWIHIADVVGIIDWMLTNPSKGIYNAVSPNPVSMRDFCKTLGLVMKRPSIFPVPKLILQALMGEMSQIVLDSQCVYPNELTKQGYKFYYSSLKEALEDLWTNQNKK